MKALPIEWIKCKTIPELEDKIDKWEHSENDKNKMIRKYKWNTQNLWDTINN